MSTARFIGKLPHGYEWELIGFSKSIRIFGKAVSKPAIGFILQYDSLKPIDMTLDDSDEE